MTMLGVRGLHKHFGGVLAVDDIGLELAEGELHAVIGPNGAGKTTLVHLLSGALKPDAGTIVLDGRDIARLAMHRRVRLGLARSYQITSVFPNMTALENLALAVQGASGRDDRDRSLPGRRGPGSPAPSCSGTRW